MKRLSRLTALLLTLAMLLSLVSIAHAEEKQSATAWLLYFASNHETDSSKFPWWPQHKSADQPSSETGVEATNAEVTGPGMYTVSSSTGRRRRAQFSSTSCWTTRRASSPAIM